MAHPHHLTIPSTLSPEKNILSSLSSSSSTRKMLLSTSTSLPIKAIWMSALAPMPPEQWRQILNTIQDYYYSSQHHKSPGDQSPHFYDDASLLAVGVWAGCWERCAHFLWSSWLGRWLARVAPEWFYDPSMAQKHPFSPSISSSSSSTSIYSLQSFSHNVPKEPEATLSSLPNPNPDPQSPLPSTVSPTNRTPWTIALNCQNAYEDCEALHHQLKYKTSQLRHLQMGGLSATMGLWTLWTFDYAQYFFSRWYSNRIELHHHKEQISTTTRLESHYKNDVGLGREQRRFHLSHSAVEWLSLAGILVVIGTGLQHWNIARREGWWRAVDYYYIELPLNKKVKVEIIEQQVQTKNAFLIRKDVFWNRPLHLKERRLLDLPLYGLGILFLTHLWGGRYGS